MKKVYIVSTENFGSVTFNKSTKIVVADNAEDARNKVQHFLPSKSKVLEVCQVDLSDDSETRIIG